MARKSTLIALFTALALGASALPAWATVSDPDVRTVTALGNGVTVNYTIGFSFQDNDEVEVYLQDESTTPYTRTLKTITTHYTITGGDPGTTVHMLSAPTATQRLIIQRATALTQPVQYDETSAFPASDHEEQMDRMVQMLQELDYRIGSAVAIDPASTASAPVFPDPTTDAYLKYNSSSELEAASYADVLSDISACKTTNNLSDLTSASSARSNLGLGTAAVLANTTATWNANKIQGTTVDASAISNGRVLTYDSGSGNIIWSPAPLSPNLTDSHLFVGNASNQAVDVAVSGDVTLANTGAVTIAAGAVTNAKIAAGAGIPYSKLALTNSVLNGDLAQIATARFKGRTTAGTGDVEDLTATQATAMLNAMVGDSGSGGTKGMVPAPASGDAAAGKFLKADGTWTAPAGAGTVTSVTFTGDGTVLSSTPSSAVTGSGTVTASIKTQTARTFLSGPLSGAAANPTFKALTAPTVQKFTSTGTTTGYLFTISTSSTVAVNDTYTNNGQTFTVLAALSAQSGQVLYTSAAGAPAASGNLTRATGAGTATIAFTSSVALATYTAPTNPAPLFIRVRMVGGGGGGNGGGSTLVLGAAGSVTTFGASLLVANGGSNGATHNANPGLGGSASLGTGPVGTAIGGGRGGPGTNAAGATSGLSGGNGAVSPFGGAGSGGNNNANLTAGSAAEANSGSGGGGGAGTASSAITGSGGGAGGFVDAIITSPSTTYPYAVGAGGSGGAAGTNGVAGGAGGSGYIEVTEFYQ